MADLNRVLFESIIRLLAPVIEELVFVGGCTTGLFITDPAAGGIRATRDVDAIVDVTSYAKYTALSERLRTLGLAEDSSPGAPLCRWRRDDRWLAFSCRIQPARRDVVSSRAAFGRSPRRDVNAAIQEHLKRCASTHTGQKCWLAVWDAFRNWLITAA